MAKSPMTLGELVSTLKRKDPETSIKFDFVHFRPDGTIHSYRGDYAQIALGYGTDGDPKVGQILKLCEDAIYKDFTGYKGGEYTTSEKTPVFVAKKDESDGTAVVDVQDHGWIVTLETAYFD